MANEKVKQKNNNDSIKKLLKSKKKKHPVFKQPNFGRTKRKRVKDKWRKPRGIDNAQAKKLKKAGRLPRIGYKNPDVIRNLHPSGRKEVLIENLNQLEELKANENPKFIIIRLKKSLSIRKKKEITQRALSLGFKVANPK